MVESVAVNLYQRSWEADEAQAGAVLLIVIPLNEPVVLTQVAPGVNVTAFTHSSWPKTAKTDVIKANKIKIFVIINIYTQQRYSAYMTTTCKDVADVYTIVA